jgi:hypothetical protein
MNKATWIACEEEEKREREKREEEEAARRFKVKRPVAPTAQCESRQSILVRLRPVWRNVDALACATPSSPASAYYTTPS